MKSATLFPPTWSTALVAAAVLASPGIAHAQPGFKVMHAFNQPIDGKYPDSALIQATDGNFYGTTALSAVCCLLYSGTVFKMSPAGDVTTLHTFGGIADGIYPAAGLLQATNGNFYGTTFFGGTSNLGTIFTMTPTGTVTILHSFAGGTTDGARPVAALIQVTDGNLYGTTANGGESNSGTVFTITPAGAFTLLHAFAGGTTDGANPQAALVQASDGNFYGTTAIGGTPGGGTVFTMTPAGLVTVLHGFASGSMDGTDPRAGLIQATDGNFYGTTHSGGGFGRGTVFTMTPAGIVTVLHSFAGGTTDGANPDAALVQATDGNFYGTTSVGGYNQGTIFQMTPAGAVTILHRFLGGPTGGGGNSALMQATDGGLYGTTALGGHSDAGTVFRIVGVPPPPVNRAAMLHDLDGDGQTDLAVFRPSSATWYVRYSSLGNSTANAGVFQWGLPGDVPISGDFDGDGKVELTVFRPATGTWYIRYSSLGYGIASAGVFQWGLPGDVPITGDFDGDGKTDLAVWRPSNGTWYIRYSSLDFSTANAGMFQWGLPADVPITGDFDGDGNTDLAIWRPSTGTWYIRYSSLGYSIANADTFQWGLPGDVPIAGDFDGDGRIDLTVFRPSTGAWFIRYSSRNYSLSTYGVYQWGLPGDVLVK